MTIIYTDGASRGNPGNCSCGILILDENKKEIIRFSKYLGVNTNNFAEYMGVFLALKKCGELKLNKITIYSDSQLLVKQINKEYEIKSEILKPIYDKIEEIKKENNFKINWIKREENKVADSIANLELDKLENKPDLKSDVKRDLKKTFSNDMLQAEKVFFGKINCLKIQLTKNFELFLNVGKVEHGKWSWEKAKILEIEISQIILLLKKQGEDKVSFFHKYKTKTTQLWFSKSSDRLTIKINKISKSLTDIEFYILKIFLNESLKKILFKNL